MPNRFKFHCFSLFALSLSTSAVLAQQDDALATLYAQQSLQVRTLVDQLGSSDSSRQQFALWQLELELAVPPGSEAQPMLEEAAAAGVLTALEGLSSSEDVELATSAAGLRAKLIEALGLAEPPAQPTRILNGISSESLGPGEHASWLALDIEAGKEYRVRAAGCDLVSTLVVSGDDLAVVDGGFAVNSSFAFTSTRDEAVLMRVRPASCSSAGMVNISAGAPLRSISGSFSSDEATLISDGRYMGRLGENDQQWMYLSLPAGKSVEIVASPEEPDLDTYLTIFDVAGQARLAEDDDGGSGLGSRLVYTSAVAGEVLIEVSRLGSNWGEYELTISEMLPPTERGQPVELGAAYSGDLTFDSRQWWLFEPEAGVRYRVEAAPDDSLDTYMTLYEIDGSTLIDEDDDDGNGFGSRIDFARPSDAPVLIEVHSLNDEPGTYRLTMSESALVFDHTEHAVGAGSYRGRIDDSGESFWRLATPAGRYRAEVVPLGGLDSVITLYDSDGANQLGYDDDGGQGFGSLLEFASVNDTTHVIGVGSFGGVGDFELTLSALPDPTELAETAEPGGIYRSGVRYDDARWWRIDAQSGMSYDIEALPRGDLDTIMELYAADGLTQLDRDDDGGQGLGSRIRYMSESNQPILIKVTGLNGSVGEFELIVR